MCKGDYVEYVRLIMSYRLRGISEIARIKCIEYAIRISCCQKKTLDKGDINDIILLTPKSFVVQETRMTRKESTDPKVVALQKKGALNSKADQITDPLFRGDEFFDPKDLVQVKYEMLRRVRKDGKSVTEAAAAFAISRFSFYEAQSALNRDGLPGLVPKKPGPRGGHKITPEVQVYIEEVSSKEICLDARDLLAKLKERFGVIVHPRTIERALARTKKKRR